MSKRFQARVRALCLIVCFVVAGVTANESGAQPVAPVEGAQPVEGYLEASPGGRVFGRTFTRLTIPGAKCGDGEGYDIFISLGPRDTGGGRNSRLVIWLDGGGSTQVGADGQLITPINDLSSLIDRLTPPADLTEKYVNERDFIFSDSPQDDSFVKDATWVILPYCTQDFHSGNREEPVTYDFTQQRQLVRQIEEKINHEGLAYFREKYPYIHVTGHFEMFQYVIDQLQISILHDGARNVRLSLSVMFDLLRVNGFDMSHADVLLGGASAGAFGVWYDAWMLGDVLYQHPGARLTLVPESGSPRTMKWSDAAGDLVADAGQTAEILQRLSWYRVTLPSDIIGANYKGGDKCLDALDLLDHYNRRWRGMDVKFLLTLNKEDAIAVAALGPGTPGFPERLLNFCRTVHRYAQYTSRMENTYTYLAWLFFREGGDLVRVHGFKYAAAVVSLTGINCQQQGIGHLEYINMVASRKIQGAVQIAEVAGIINNPGSPDSNVTLRIGYLQESNVPWPPLSVPEKHEVIRLSSLRPLAKSRQSLKP